MMAASFASRGLVNTAAALAIMLGADIGTSVVAQLYSFKPPSLSPILILVGVVMFMTSEATRRRDLGRAIIGLGLVLTGAADDLQPTPTPLRDSPVLIDMMAALADAPVIAVIVGAVRDAALDLQPGRRAVGHLARAA